MACGGGGTVKEKGKEILSDLSRDPDPEEEDSVIMTRKQGIPKPRIIIPNPRIIITPSSLPVKSPPPLFLFLSGSAP